MVEGRAKWWVNTMRVETSGGPAVLDESKWEGDVCKQLVSSAITLCREWARLQVCPVRVVYESGVC